MFNFFLDKVNSFIPEQIQKTMFITLVAGTAVIFGLGGYLLGGGSHISFDREGKLTIGRRPLPEILEELDNLNRQELKDFAAYYGPLADKGFYKAEIMMNFIDRKMEARRLSSQSNSLTNSSPISELERWVDAHDDDFINDHLHKFRYYHLLDDELVAAIKNDLKIDDNVAQELRKLAHLGEGPFKVEKVMISVLDRPEGTALACQSSELLNKIVYLTSRENQSANKGKPAYISVDVAEMFNCSENENFDPCDQENHPLALTKISKKNWLQISKKDASRLFPLSARKNSFDKCQLAAVKISELPGMP